LDFPKTTQAGGDGRGLGLSFQKFKRPQIAVDRLAVGFNRVWNDSALSDQMAAVRFQWRPFAFL
jgi:hypothetical protein